MFLHILNNGLRTFIIEVNPLFERWLRWWHLMINVSAPFSICNVNQISIQIEIFETFFKVFKASCGGEVVIFYSLGAVTMACFWVHKRWRDGLVNFTDSKTTKLCANFISWHDETYFITSSSVTNDGLKPYKVSEPIVKKVAASFRVGTNRREHNGR